jgi:TatD DNase family protein
MQLTDTHCHIHFEDYGLDPEKVIEDASKAGVSKLICVGVDLADSQRAIDFAGSHDNVWASAGAHPHDGADYIHTSDAQARLKKLLIQPKVVAVGEIGLDYYYEHSDRDSQKEALRSQLAVGLEANLPFIFHVRDAFPDFFAVLDEFRGEAIRGVIHSFSAHLPELEQALKRDFYIGLNGIMTFTKDEQQLAAAKAVPLEKLLLETDAPFLTPKPFRGTICESKHVALTAEFMANLRMTPLEALASATTSNADKLFSLV